MDSRFTTTALSGRTMDRNTVMSNRNDTTSTAAMKPGRRLEHALAQVDVDGGAAADDHVEVRGRDHVVAEAVDQRRGALVLRRADRRMRR